jgi:hypothetical protein
VTTLSNNSLPKNSTVIGATSANAQNAASITGGWEPCARKTPGPLVQAIPTLLAGSLMSDASVPDFSLFWNGVSGKDAAYGWQSIDRAGPLAVWANVGCKLAVPYQFPEVM